jgi:hypothetical protein
MKTPKNIDVLFVAGFGPIVRDPVASRKSIPKHWECRSKKMPTAICIPVGWTA